MEGRADISRRVELIFLEDRAGIYGGRLIFMEGRADISVG